MGAAVSALSPTGTVCDALVHWAVLTPDATALQAPGHESITHGELRAAVDQLAGELRAHGLGRGDGVALIVPEGSALCVAILAAMSVGIAVPLAWPAAEREHAAVLANSPLRAMLVSEDVFSAGKGFAANGLPLLTLRAGGGDRTGSWRVDGPVLGNPVSHGPPGADDVGLILHSSGTTGVPKRVPRTHRAMAAACATVIAARAKTPSDRCLSLARTSYSQGIKALLYAIASGGSLVSAADLDARVAAGWLTAFRPTYISTGPAVLRGLAALDGEFVDAVRQSPLKSIHSTAGALEPGELAGLEAQFGAPILNGYGLSEAPGVAGERFPRERRVPGSVGKPWCEVEIRRGEIRPVAVGECGEIVVRGATVFPGYLDDPAANAAAFLPGGWFRTGDEGFLDEAGYLHLTGRLDETINRGGEKIVPGEVENALNGHLAVAEAAAFAVPDGRLGQDIVVAVVIVPGVDCSARDVRRWLAPCLSSYKIPRRIWFVERLRRTRTGKVQRAELTRLWNEAQW